MASFTKSLFFLESFDVLAFVDGEADLRGLAWGVTELQLIEAEAVNL